MLDIIEHGEFAELKMHRPPVNALNHALLQSLLDGLESVQVAGTRGIVMSGQQGMFSAGIDVPELLGLDREAIRDFWSLLFRTTRALATSEVPVVAAITGHSPAGGAVLATHCDYRIGAAGEFKIGFNEVQVGLPLPATIMVAFESLVGARKAALLGTQGRLLTMADAQQFGLVDELVAAEELIDRSLEWLHNLNSLPPIAMNTTRLSAKSKLIAAFEVSEDVDRTTEYWFSAETQDAMKRLVDSLAKK